jgi:phytoene desaturase
MQGLPYFTVPELVDELFVLAGKNPKEYFNYERLEDVCHYFYEDGTTLTAWADVNKFAQEAQEKTGVDKQQVLQHLKKSEYIYNSTAHLFLEKSLHKLSSYLSLKTAWSILQLPFLKIFTTMDAANASAYEQ